MTNNMNLSEEYINEISKIEITAKDMFENKITAQTLKTELFLQKIYGDKINQKNLENVNILGRQKSINKITEDDIGMGSSIKAVCELIDESKFDENLETLLR